MVAELYIVEDSFANNVNFSTPEIENKVKALSTDFVKIREFKDTNKLFVHPDIYNVEFIKGVILSDLVYNWQLAKQHIDRDVYNALQKIIVESATSIHTSKEVIEVLLQEHSEDLCRGLIAFNPVENIEQELQIIYDNDGWLKFRRHFLKVYPKNEIFFINECRKYFPKVFFHENTITTISNIFPIFVDKVIFHLTALNDKFRESQDGYRNRQDVLTHFSQNCNLDAQASLEGHAERKPFFTYTFRVDEKTEQKVCCEPHLKLCSSGVPGDNTYYQHRIYFHEGLENIENNKILIGHIGEHINFD